MSQLTEDCYYCPCFAKCIDMIFTDDAAINCEYVGHMKKWVEETVEKLNEIAIPNIEDAEMIKELVYFTGRYKTNICDIFTPVEKCSSCLKRYGCTCQEEYNCKKNDYSMYEADVSSNWL